MPQPKYYTTDNKIREFLLSTSKLFNCKEDLVIEINKSIREHKQFSLEYYFYVRVLEELNSSFFLFSR